MMRSSASLLALLVIGAPFAVRAAGGIVAVEPGSGAYVVGDNFTIDLIADTGGSVVQAIEAELSFNPQVVVVDHISTRESILTSWPTAPNYANDAGQLGFAGWISERFSGSRGKLVSVTFTAVGVGSSPITIESAAMLSHEGQATNVVSALKSGVVSVAPRSETPPVTQIVPQETAPADVVLDESAAPPRDESTASAQESMSSSQAAAVAEAAQFDLWWPVSMLLLGCGIGMCMGYALRGAR